MGTGDARVRARAPDWAPRAAVAWARPGAWRGAAFGALALAATLDRYTLEVAGVSVKLEHVALGLAWLGALWALLARGWRPRLGRGLWPFAAMLAVLLAASLLNAPDRLVSLRHTAMIALVLSGAWLVYWLVDTPARLRAAAGAIIALAVLEAAAAFGGLALARFYIPFGAAPGRGGIAVPYGTLWEPNVLGSYLAAGAALTLAALLAAPAGRRGWAYTGALALIGAALSLSLARTAWAGLGVAAVLVVWGAWRGGLRSQLARGLGRAAVALGAVGLFLLLLAPALFPGTSRGLQARADVAAYNPAADPSLQARVDTLRGALPGVLAHPILGNGAGSYAAHHLDEQGAPGWIGNLELHLLYDSGALGLALALGGLALVAGSAARALRRTAGGAPDHAVILGLLAAGAALFVAYQATEGTWLAYTWVYVGLLARAGAAPRATD
jgi:O-antigen ligase